MAVTGVCQSPFTLHFCFQTGGRPRIAPATSATSVSTRNTKKRILAIPAAAPAIVLKPSTAAMIATMKNVSAQDNMTTSSIAKATLCGGTFERGLGSGIVVRSVQQQAAHRTVHFMSWNFICSVHVSPTDGRQRSNIAEERHEHEVFGAWSAHLRAHARH